MPSQIKACLLHFVHTILFVLTRPIRKNGHLDNGTITIATACADSYSLHVSLYREYESTHSTFFFSVPFALCAYHSLRPDPAYQKKWSLGQWHHNHGNGMR